MPLTTASAAIHIAPVVMKTFFNHGKRKAERLRKKADKVPHDNIFFDEAFHIVKAFIELGTKNTIESLQAFTNTHIPAPYWAAVSPVTVSLSSCNAAADSLIEWFGPEELKYVVGGERWWQVRGLDGVDAEWIAELEDLDFNTEVNTANGKKLSNEDANIKRMETLETVMLYVHGGGYFWGSINTHRYQILHYAHKFRGRAFAVNYRKAPQYPWPCALQDVLAAYLYLIRPPPDAIHTAVPHSRIVFAGDSAGGGLCVTMLTILRDLGLPMPAGAVLISPWVDLTHSFPSVMQNCDTDIIPKHGFLAKPSTLWSVPTQLEEGGRIVASVSNPPPMPGDADTLKPSASRIDIAQAQSGKDEGDLAKSQQEMFDEWNKKGPRSMKPSVVPDKGRRISEALESHGLDSWEPKPPKVFMEDHNAQPLELRSQIQMYATTEQLAHPLVSPILQGSLGNLPPLYIIAGDGELLRDEVVYLAHKAAHPSKYPARDGVLRDSVRQKENSKKFTTPTKVHLQVFDGMCHVLTVFIFTQSARYAYWSIAEFAKHVTQNDPERILKNPFPELHHSSWFSSDSYPHKAISKKNHRKSQKKGIQTNKEDPPPTPSPSSRIDMDLYLRNEQMALLEVNQGLADVQSNISYLKKHTEENYNLASVEDEISGTLMIRERVDIHGIVRPMEPASTLQALQVDVSHIGILKEAPAQRWREGQHVWDTVYSKKAKNVAKQKSMNRVKAERLLQNAIEQGFVHQSHQVPENFLAKKSTSQDKIQKDRRWGPFDLEDEKPPATAIAGRLDTLEALALLKTHIYHAAPVTHLTVPEFKTPDTRRATFYPNYNSNKSPKQSPAEEQVTGRIVSMHGLRLWGDILRYCGRKTAAKAMHGISTVTERAGLKNEVSQ